MLKRKLIFKNNSLQCWLCGIHKNNILLYRLILLQWRNENFTQSITSPIKKLSLESLLKEYMLSTYLETKKDNNSIKTTKINLNQQKIYVDTWKDLKITTDFVMDLIFWLARRVWVCLIIGSGGHTYNPSGWIRSFLGVGLICWKASSLRIWLASFQVWDNLIESTGVNLHETLMKDCFRDKFQDDQ